MKHCETCKHWTTIVMHFGDDHACEKINQESRGTPAWTQDAEDYWSSLRTRADFGCVLWEQK